MKRLLFFSALLTIMLLVSACGENGNSDEGESNKKESENTSENQTNSTEGSNSSSKSETEGKALTVKLKDAEGKEVALAELTEKENGVQINIEATDLTPGKHGFHIHETGKCEAPDFKSAGGHFNPTDASHGKEHGEASHAGDLPNLEISEDGTGSIEYLAENVTLKSGEKQSLVGEDGTALIIHEGADDYKSQPSGDAGSRVACGVIGE